MSGCNLTCWSLSTSKLPENCLCSTAEAFKWEVCLLLVRAKAKISFHEHFFVDIFICAVEKKKNKYALSSFSCANRVAFFSCGKHTFQTGSRFRTLVVHSLPVWDQLRLICNTESGKWLFWGHFPAHPSSTTLLGLSSQPADWELGPSLWPGLLQMYQQCKPCRTGHN